MVTSPSVVVHVRSSNAETGTTPISKENHATPPDPIRGVQGTSARPGDITIRVVENDLSGLAPTGNSKISKTEGRVVGADGRVVGPFGQVEGQSAFEAMDSPPAMISSFSPRRLPAAS